MKKVKHILATFVHSFVPQDIYYPKLLHTRFQFSFKYYFIVLSFFALIITGIVVYQVSPIKMAHYKNATIRSLMSFPDDVKLTFTKGILETNLDKPLFLWVYDGSQPLFMFMVQTRDKMENAHIPLPLVFLGQDKAQISYKGSVFVRPYNSSWNFLITKPTIQSFITQTNSYFPAFILFFYTILIVLVPLTFMVGVSLLVLLSSFLVFVLLRTFIPHIHLKKCIQASMHGTHVPLFTITLLFALFPFVVNVATIAVSLIFVFTLVSVYEMYSKDTGHRKGR